MTNNINTVNAMITEAKRIAAAHAQTPDPANVTAYHDLWENAKQALSRDDQALLWECMKPKASGIDRFAGKKWRADHPEAPASPMPKYVTDAQEKRKAEKAAEPKAEKPAAPKANKRTKAKADKPATPKADKPKAGKPTYTETLAQVVECLNRVNENLGQLTALNAQGFAAIDKRLGAIEKKLAK
jgi:hypothetical protein